jgi:hypothetical protein
MAPEICMQVGVTPVRPFARLREGKVPLNSKDKGEKPPWRTSKLPQDALSIFAAASRAGIRDGVLNKAAARLQEALCPRA